MTQSIASLVEELDPDPWRNEIGFSLEIAEAQDRILAAQSDGDRVAILSDWLSRWQPCLFGRIAAKSGGLRYCILSEQDLQRSDEEIKRKIQGTRHEWSRDAFSGGSSGFVILAASRSIAVARPNSTVRELARRLASLYLLRDIPDNTICQEEICLELPTDNRATYLWYGGVNYFCAQGDGRWWNDHRIPGGMAFSVNSVGHMVRSGQLARIRSFIQDELKLTLEGPVVSKVDSLEKALELAMRTISLASTTRSGRATELLPLPADRSGLPPCPVQLPPFLIAKNHCEYRGWYHTDFTLPAEYFQDDVSRPAEIHSHRLDFTYLFDRSTNNLDFDALATGRRIRAGRERAETRPQGYFERRLRAEPELVPIDRTTLLKRALHSANNGHF